MSLSKLVHMSWVRTGTLHNDHADGNEELKVSVFNEKKSNDFCECWVSHVACPANVLFCFL